MRPLTIQYDDTDESHCGYLILRGSRPIARCSGVQGSEMGVTALRHAEEIVTAVNAYEHTKA